MASSKLKRKTLASSRILVVATLSVLLAVAASGQSGPPQLQVAVGPNQQICILASHVTYGEVLRALRTKLGWEIEIPPLADELKLNFLSVQTSQPQVALTKLLQGSGLGYAFLDEQKTSGNLKVLVIPLAPRDTKATQEEVPVSTSTDSQSVADGSPPAPPSVQSVTPNPPNMQTPDTTLDKPQPLTTMSMADAANVIGAPPGVAPSEIGKSMTLSLADAARMIGAPPGTSPDTVGKTMTLPLPTGPGKHP